MLNQNKPTTTAPSQNQPTQAEIDRANALLNLYNNPKAGSSPEIIQGSQELSPETYTLLPQADIQKEAALQQGNWKKAGNALVAGLGKTALKLLETVPAISSPIATAAGYQRNAMDDLYAFYQSGETSLDKMFPIYDQANKLDGGDVAQFTRDMGSEILSSIGIAGIAGKLGAAGRVGALGTAIAQGQVNAYRQANEVYNLTYSELVKTINPETGVTYSELEAQDAAMTAAKWNYGAESLLGTLNYASALRAMQILDESKQNAAQKAKNLLWNMFGTQAVSEGLEEGIEYGLTKAAQQVGLNSVMPDSKKVRWENVFTDAVGSEEGMNNIVLGYLGGAMGATAQEVILPAFRNSAKKLKDLDQINKLFNSTSVDNQISYEQRYSNRAEKMNLAMQHGDIAQYNELKKDEWTDAQYQMFKTGKDTEIRKVIDKFSNSQSGKDINVQELLDNNLIQDSSQLNQFIANNNQILSDLDRNKGIYENLSHLPEDVRFDAFGKYIQEADSERNLQTQQTELIKATSTLEGRIATLYPDFELSSMANLSDAQKLAQLAELYPEFTSSPEFIRAEVAQKKIDDTKLNISNLKAWTRLSSDPDAYRGRMQKLVQTETIDNFLKQDFESIESMQDELNKIADSDQTREDITAKINNTVSKLRSREIGQVEDSELPVLAYTDSTSETPTFVNEKGVVNVIHPEDVVTEITPEDQVEISLPESLLATGLVDSYESETTKLDAVRKDSESKRSKKTTNAKIGYELARTTKNITDTATMEFAPFYTQSGRYLGARYDSVGRPILNNAAVELDYTLLNSQEVAPGTEVELEYIQTLQIGPETTTEAIVVKFNNQPITYVAKSETSQTYNNQAYFDYLKGRIQKGLTRTKIVGKDFRALGDVVKVPAMGIDIWLNSYQGSDKDNIKVVAYNKIPKDGSVLDLSDAYYRGKKNNRFILIDSPISGKKIPLSLEHNAISNLSKTARKKVVDSYYKEIQNLSIMAKSNEYSQKELAYRLNQLAQKYTDDPTTTFNVAFLNENKDLIVQMSNSEKFLNLSDKAAVVKAIIDPVRVNPELAGLDWKTDNVYSIDTYPLRPVKDSRLQLSLDTKLPRTESEQTQEFIEIPVVSSDEGVLDSITPEEWENFINVGYISPTRIDNLVERIISGNPLSQRELSIYTQASTEIESRLVAATLPQTEDQIQVSQEAIESTSDVVSRIAELNQTTSESVTDLYMNDPVGFNEEVSTLVALQHEQREDSTQLTELEQALQNPDHLIYQHPILGQNSFVKENITLSFIASTSAKSKAWLDRLYKSGTKRSSQSTVGTRSGSWVMGPVPDVETEVISETNELAIDSNLYNQFYRKMLTDINLRKNLKELSDADFSDLYRMKKADARKYLYFTNLDKLGITLDTVSKNSPDVYELIQEYWQLERENTYSGRGMSRLQSNRTRFNQVYFRINSMDLARFYELDTETNFNPEPDQDVSPNQVYSSKSVKDSEVDIIEETMLLNDPNFVAVGPNSIKSKGVLQPETMKVIIDNFEDFRVAIQEEVDSYGYTNSTLSQLLNAGYKMDGFYKRQTMIESLLFPEQDPNELERDFIDKERDLDNLNLC